MFHIRWFGYDPDGRVTGYYLQVDDGPEVWTTNGDSAIAFESSVNDPGNPGKTYPMEHTIKVTAVDNEDVRDPSPAERLFFAVNDIPVVTSFSADFADDDTVGSAIDFSVVWEDENSSGVFFRVLVDGEAVTEWEIYSSFQFCDTSDPSITAGIEGTYLIDVTELPTGVCTLAVEVKDWGGAVSDPVERRIVVVDGKQPVITGVTGLYGTSEFYADGSIFYQQGRVTTMTIAGSADDYFSGVQGYRYSYDGGAVWSTWSGATISLDLSAGDYDFLLQCRDYAGSISEVDTFQLSIVQADFTGQTILVIDETRDGNGRPGSPDDEQCDEFYAYTLSGLTADGWTVTDIDYIAHGEYVSPRDVFNQRIVIWHADDITQKFLGDNLRILQEYLDRGGRLILSGWDVMGTFTGDDSTGFGGFAGTYLRVASGMRDPSRNTARGLVGVEGDATFGYPALSWDPEKASSRWVGLDRCWVLYPSRRTDAFCGWVGSDPASPYEGGACVLRNFHPAIAWKTITFGFPLYFMQNDQAKLFIERAIEDINE
ncbi:MAG: hypothetical protein P9M15_05075 [Candidatus Electryoneaceae bacterium]|nr:hypothetical protein [Candidatus Electryoneaceae bacterium]